MYKKSKGEYLWYTIKDGTYWWNNGHTGYEPEDFISIVKNSTTHFIAVKFYIFFFNIPACHTIFCLYISAPDKVNGKHVQCRFFVISVLPISLIGNIHTLPEI